jgi:hypothetical protein
VNNKDDHQDGDDYDKDDDHSNSNDNNNTNNNNNNNNNNKNHQNYLRKDEDINESPKSQSDFKSSFSLSTSSPDANKKKVSTSTYYKLSTLLALIITIPGIVVLFVLRHFDIDIIYQIIFSSLAFFICIGLSFKISSKLTKFYKLKQ